MSRTSSELKHIANALSEEKHVACVESNFDERGFLSRVVATTNEEKQYVFTKENAYFIDDGVEVCVGYIEYLLDKGRTVYHLRNMLGRNRAILVKEYDKAVRAMKTIPLIDKDRVARAILEEYEDADAATLSLYNEAIKTASLRNWK